MTASRWPTSSPIEHKHNEANGEDNRDGTERQLLVEQRRRRRRPTIPRSSRRAAARPARPAGDAASVARHADAGDGRRIRPLQDGNNNAYAQDNALSWLDWAKADAALADFTRV